MGVHFQATLPNRTIPPGRMNQPQAGPLRRMPMDPKKKSRRKFLKGSAAVAGLAVGGAGLAVGSAIAPAGASLRPADNEDSGKSIEELVAYGDRSKFVTSVRIPV